MSEPTESTGRAVADQAEHLATRAGDRAGTVAAEVGDQAQAVMRDAQGHAREVMDRTRQDIEQQAEQRSGQAADGLRSLAGNVRALAEGRPDEAGPLVHYLHDAGDRLGGVADRFEQGPQAVLGDVRSFARRRPIAFLGICGALGFVAGRLARAGAAGDGSSTSSGESNGAVDPLAAQPPTTMPPPSGLEPPTAVTAGSATAGGAVYPMADPPAGEAPR